MGVTSSEAQIFCNCTVQRAKPDTSPFSVFNVMIQVQDAAASGLHDQAWASMSVCRQPAVVQGAPASIAGTFGL